MGLLNPGALYFLAIVPALIVAYLARERPRQVTVSSVLAFRALHRMRGERFGGRPRFRWTFFLELLILMLAVLAMANPYIARKRDQVAVVLDNSAPMQAEIAHGETRYGAAVAWARQELANEPADTAVTVYLTAPTPHPVTGASSSPQAAAVALDKARVSDAPVSPPAAFAGLLTQLAADRHLKQIIVASYRAIAPPVPSQVQALVPGGVIPNYAIGSFALTSSTLGATTLRGRLTVANFSPAPATLKADVTADGKPAADAQALVQPGDVATLEFPNLPLARVYQAQLQPSDGFSLDNVAFATAPGVATVSILFVSPVAADGESLKSIPGVDLTTRSPDAFTPKDLIKSDIAIFEYTVPKELPSVNSLFVIPPPSDPIFQFATVPIAQLQLTGWPMTDPLTDGVNFRLLNLRSGEYLGQHPWMQAVVSGAEGGLLLAGDRQGHRYVATGFNPFPYLGRQNLPMSILTLNLLSRLTGLGAPAAGYRTGESWIVPAGVSQIALPSGERVAVAQGQTFTHTEQQGIYRLTGSGEPTLRAVNLSDLTASDLQNIAPVEIGSAATAGATTGTPLATSLTPYVIALIIALIVIEALFVYRGRIIEATP
jgi:hypothetical protein